MKEKSPEIGTWIPYQEFRPALNSSHIAKRTSPSNTISPYTSMRPDATSEVLDEFSYAMPSEILQHMLESVKNYHGNAYGKYCWRLRDSSDEFLDLLLPQARQVLLSRDYSRTNLLTINDGPPKRGIYLHVLWLKAVPEIYYLYVGQSIEIQTRLQNHRDPSYRVRNPSFHYFIWDRGVDDENLEVDEKFVFLSACNDDDPKLLKLLEMWCCLILQTLTKNTLLKYLPSCVVAPGAGRHLNIAIPLLQPPHNVAINNEDLSVYQSDDPLVQQHYASLRRRFYELKFSPSLTHQRYHQDVLRQRVITRVENNTKSVATLLNGIGVNVAVRKDPRWNSTIFQTFTLSYFRFRIPRAWGILEDSVPIQVRPLLMSKRLLSSEEQPPHAYCSKATEKDPASRLAIFVEGTLANGESFEGWLKSSGKKDVYKMNTFVDLLEGGTMMQSKEFPRRWICLKHRNEQWEVQPRRWYTA